MGYYLLLFGLLIFSIFMLAYRMDNVFIARSDIFKRIKIDKTISKIFLFQNKSNGILYIALLFQIIGYLAIPISIFLSYHFVQYGYSVNVEFNRNFGKTIYSLLAGEAVIFITLLLINFINQKSK